MQSYCRLSERFILPRSFTVSAAAKSWSLRSRRSRSTFNLASALNGLKSIRDLFSANTLSTIGRQPDNSHRNFDFPSIKESGMNLADFYRMLTHNH